MSLINEALKKAQRSRHEGALSASAPSVGEGGAIAKRAQPKSAKSTLLIIAGAVVLVVGSMVGTALWLTRPVHAPTVAATKPAKVVDTKSDELPAIKPLVSLPPATPAASAASDSDSPAVPAKEPAPTPKPSVAAAVAARPVPAKPKPAETVAPTAPAAVPAAERPLPPPVPDERIHQFVEAIKVAGIRSSGTESKVLMNDRVFRVNDVVDRSLGLRLTKVSPDSLTFTDANGATYVKYF